MYQEGYIKLHRSMMSWEWWHNPNLRAFWVYLLLRANWEDGRFEGQVVPRGSFVSSYPKMAEESGASYSTVRRYIKRLENSGEITVKSTNRWTVISIVKYGTYQTFEKTSEQTDEQTGEQTDEQTSEQQYKNIRNKEIKNIDDDRRARERDRLSNFSSYFDSIQEIQDIIDKQGLIYLNANQIYNRTLGMTIQNKVNYLIEANDQEKKRLQQKQEKPTTNRRRKIDTSKYKNGGTS